jgi:uncharacterized protein
MATVFGEFRVRIDPWEVDYGDQMPLAPTDDELDEKVDHQVEIVEGEWRAIAPPEGSAPHQRVVFIDGVRRLEARFHARQGTQILYGGFGSFAVGAVALENSSASFGEVRVFRATVLGAGQRLPEAVQVQPGLIYLPETTPLSQVDAPLRHIQKSMRQAEATLARDLCREDALTIVDGPLSFEPERRGVALGYIKRVHELYLPGRFIPLLATLPEGTRTPIFAIQSASSGFARFAWFQRLAAPGPGATEMHGIVRLEVATNVGIAAARNLANAATSWLPRTAPNRACDPRSPQNLLPIGALERKLRSALGDAKLIRRWIEALVAKEASRD